MSARLGAVVDNDMIPVLPKDHDSIKFKGWDISYTKSHILKSVCSDKCTPETENPCELCTYEHSLGLPHLPDMVFHKNALKLVHENGATIEFNPMEALRLVQNGKMGMPVACADEWRESRPQQHTEEKCKPFDWTYTTDYRGTLNDKYEIEEVKRDFDFKKLMLREDILFYTDLTLFEDELHDNGIAKCSVKIRVMPSGYFILLRYFLRLDKVMCLVNDTRYHYEIENDYILREFTSRSEKYEKLTPTTQYKLYDNAIKDPDSLLPLIEKKMEKIKFK